MSTQTVILAEKPSVAFDIAQVLGANQKQEGYTEGNGYFCTWAYGHLVELAIPEEHAKWELDKLPVLPQSLDLMAAKDKEKQLKVIGQLFEKADRIIVATDAGREGEHIFRLIYEYHQCEKPFERLWISSLTDEAIKQGFENLSPGTNYDNLAFAARLRAESDLLVGVNATRALTKSVDSAQTLSLGRVQTPTLAIVCARYLEHKNFKPEDYFQLQISLDKNSQSFKAISESYKDKAEAQARLSLVQAADFAVVITVESKEKKEAPPLLYDLTSLQQEANKRFGYSADQTLKLAQSLYEAKYLTYPRTDAKYIGDDLFTSIPNLIAQQVDHLLLGEAAQHLQSKAKDLNKRSVNASKVSDHHAILPTSIKPELEELSKDERAIYDMVVARMLEAFSEICIKEITTIEMTAGEKQEKFTARGTVITQMGWRSVLGLKEEEAKEGEQAQTELPQVEEGEALAIKKAEMLSKKTKPKAIHSEATLLKAMETAGRDIEDDEAAREAMKDSGLGTPATRAATIEKLISRGYVAREKKRLVPTEQGLTLYDSIKNLKIASPLLTGQWEKQLSEVEKGVLHPDDFEARIIPYVKESTQEIKEIGSTLSLSLAFARPSFGTCPKCKDGEMREGRKTYYCSNYKRMEEPCNFVIWKKIAQKELTAAQVSTLIEKGKTGLIKGFTSKNKKPFDAYLVLKPLVEKDEDGQEWEVLKTSFEFPPRKTNGKAKKKSKSKKGAKK